MSKELEQRVNELEAEVARLCKAAEFPPMSENERRQMLDRLGAHCDGIDGAAWDQNVIRSVEALQPGEHYAGVVVNESGQVTHHLVLMAQRPDGKLQWQAAVDWATSVGGALPTLQEQALLYTNCNPHIKPEWHWSGDTRTDNVYLAWCCSFSGGYRGIIRKSSESFAVAVRRIPVNAPAAPATAPEKCWCDEQGIGKPGVSCGGCPTRDYKTTALYARAGWAY